MHIIHFCPSSSFSGLEQYALSLALYQHKRGIPVSFVVAPDSRIEAECRKAGIITLPLTGKIALAHKIEALMNADSSNSFLFHLHTTHEIYNALFPRWKSKGRVKVLMQFHLWITHKKKDPWHKFIYKFVDEIWCSSRQAKDSLLNLLPIQDSKFRIIHYGRDLKLMRASFLTKSEARAELKIDSEQIALLNLASLHPLKGQKELVFAFKRMAEKDSQLNLYLVGGVRPKDAEADLYAHQLRNIVASDGILKDRVHFLPTIESFYKFLKAFDVFVLPSYLECFSLALLESQYAGLPIVGTNAGGTPEIVVEGKTGWLCEPADVESLADALSRCWAQRSSWEEFGLTAQKRVSQEFDQENVFEEIIQGYQRILSL